MARLKFLLFSLLVLGAWAAHLYLLSPAMSDRAVEQAQERVSAVPAAVTVHVHERRIELQRTALKVAANAQALAVLQPAKGGKIEAPDAEKLAAFKAALANSVSPELKDQLIVALANEAGAIASRGEEAAVGADALDFPAVIQAGAEGVARDAFGESHFFFAVPVSVTDKGETRIVGSAVVGAPLLGASVVEAVAKQSGVGALALLKDGKVVKAAGPQARVVEAASARLTLGKSEVIERGQISAMGPLKFPFLTRSEDFAGGGAPVLVASRQALAATPFEVVTVASVAPFMTSLAEYQQLAVGAFGGLFVLSLVFMLIMGGGSRAKKPAPAPEAAPKGNAAEAAAPAPAAPAAEPVADAAQGMAELPPPPEATPDDFPFGAPPAAEADAGGPPPLPSSQDGDAFAVPPPLEAEPPTRNAQIDAAAAFAAQQDDQPTMAYPAATDPFELAARQESSEGGGDFNPEATRVASIPEELLRASAKPEPTRPLVAAPRNVATFQPPPVQSSAPAAANNEEAHFQDVFREFVKTREQCGEPPDGLTFEKFALKLRKNKEQLVAKYQCKTVRFQVYVKEGKAALKATPIKD